jgi:hypothetical protein
MTPKSELHCDDPTKSEPAVKPGKRVVPRSCDCDMCVPMYTLADLLWRVCVDNGFRTDDVSFAGAIVTALAAARGCDNRGQSETLLGDTGDFAGTYFDNVYDWVSSHRPLTLN